MRMSPSPDSGASSSASVLSTRPNVALGAAATNIVRLGHHHVGQSAQGAVDVLSLSQTVPRGLRKHVLGTAHWSPVHEKHGGEGNVVTSSDGLQPSSFLLLGELTIDHKKVGSSERNMAQ